MTRIFLIDDHQIVHSGLKAALGEYPDVEVVGEATDGRDALRQVESLRPHLVIMDVAMPVFNGIEATIQIKKLDPKIKVIIFTMYSHREFLIPLMKAGISGYVMKSQPLADLYLAIQAAKRGETYFSEEIREYLAHLAESSKYRNPENDPFDLLSLRERQIFQMLAAGQSVREIGQQLYISHKTVETHKYNIMEKLQIRSMTEWTKEAVRRNIIQI